MDALARVSASVQNLVFTFLQPYEHCMLGATCVRLREMAQESTSWTLLMRVWVLLYGFHVTQCDWQAALDVCADARRRMRDHGLDPESDRELRLASNWIHFEIAGPHKTAVFDSPAIGPNTWTKASLDDPLEFWRHIGHLLTLNVHALPQATADTHRIILRQEVDTHKKRTYITWGPSVWQLVQKELTARAEQGSPMALLCLRRLLSVKQAGDENLGTTPPCDDGRSKIKRWLRDEVPRATHIMSLWPANLDSLFDENRFKHRARHVKRRVLM